MRHGQTGSGDYARHVEHDRDIIRILLEQNHGNQSQTAKSLGISRTTMWRMLKGHSPDQNGN